MQPINGNSMTNWILEYDWGGENRVLSETNEELISDAVDTCFAMLGDDEDRVIICMGESESKIVEIQTDSVDGQLQQFTFTKPNVDASPEMIVVDSETTLNVMKNEILSKAEALEIFLYFYHTKKCHEKYSLSKRTYYWNQG